MFTLRYASAPSRRLGRPCGVVGLLAGLQKIEHRREQDFGEVVGPPASGLLRTTASGRDREAALNSGSGHSDQGRSNDSG